MSGNPDLHQMWSPDHHIPTLVYMSLVYSRDQVLVYYLIEAII